MNEDTKEALRKAANDAINVQDACNLSGVLYTWARHQEVLRDVCKGNGSPEYFHHPVNIMFASKVASLMRVETDSLGGIRTDPDHDAFGPAYDWCKANRG